MFDNLVLYSMQHPATVILAGIGIVIILVWMTGSGSRQRFIVFKRTKETEQMARDLSRIASALERLAKTQEQPAVSSHGSAQERMDEPLPDQGSAEEYPRGFVASSPNDARAAAAHAGANTTANSSLQNPTANPNPLGGTADPGGKKKPLDLPNPFFRSK